MFADYGSWGFFAILVAQAHLKHSIKKMGTRHVHLRHVHVQQILLFSSVGVSLYLQNRSLLVFSLFIGTSLLPAPFYACNFAFVRLVAVCREAFKTIPSGTFNLVTE